MRWKPPADDGGCPIDDYDIELLCPHTKQWKKIGKSPGNSLDPNFQVTGLEEGQEYLFRVTANTSEGPSEPLVADTAIKAKNPFGKSTHSIKFTLLQHCCKSCKSCVK